MTDVRYGSVVRATSCSAARCRARWVEPTSRLGELAEEIEDLAKSLRRRLRSQVARIIQRQVKLEYSPTIDPRSGWRRTIRLARLDIGRILEDSPSLKREISRLIEKETAGAVQLAILDLEEHGEIDQMEPPAIGKTSYTEQQVLGDWFPEEPAA